MDEQADVPASRDIRSLTVDSARTEIRRSNKSIDVYPILVYSLYMSSDQQATIDRLSVALDANCDAYWRDSTITFEQWEATQNAIWAEAQRAGVLNRLLYAVAPTFKETR